MLKTIEEMRARLDEIKARFVEIDGAAEGAALDEERQTEWTELEGEYDGLKDKVKAAEARAERLAALAEEKPAVREQGSDKGAPAFHRAPDDVYDMDSLRKEAFDADDFLARVDERAKRAIDGAKYGTRDKAAAQEHVTELLEDVDTDDRTLAKRMLLTGSPAYERAFAKIMQHGNDSMCTPEERAALARTASVGQSLSGPGGAYSTQGGYAVPFQLDPTVILTSAGTVNPIRQLARVERIVGKKWQGVTSAGTTVSRGAESEEAPDSSFTLGQPELNTNRVQGFVPFSMEIDLSWNALRREITNVLVDAKASEEDSFITGDGVTGLQPGGVLGSLNPSGNSVETGSANAFDPNDVYALEAALNPRWESGASWLAHKSVYHAIRQADEGGGSALWARIGDGTPARLLDYPDYRSSAMPALSTADGAKLMLFGNFKQFLIVDRIGMTVEVVPHLMGANNRPIGQRGVYAVWMNNSKILVPSAFKVLTVQAA